MDAMASFYDLADNRFDNTMVVTVTELGLRLNRTNVFLGTKYLELVWVSN